MNANTTQPLSPAHGNPADGNPGDSTAERSSAERVVLFGLAVALPATPVLLILGTNWQAVQLLWIFAVIWTIIASFVHSLQRAIRHGDWSAFKCGEIHRNDEDLDWATKTGRYAYLRIRGPSRSPHARRRPVPAGSQSRLGPYEPRRRLSPDPNASHRTVKIRKASIPIERSIHFQTAGRLHGTGTTALLAVRHAPGFNRSRSRRFHLRVDTRSACACRR